MKKQLEEAEANVSKWPRWKLREAGINHLFPEEKQTMSAELLRNFSVECGLPAGLVVDGNTLVLSDRIFKLDDLNPVPKSVKHNEKKSLDYYVNLDYPRKFNDKSSHGKFDIYDFYNGVFVVEKENNRLAMVVPIYECHGSHAGGGIVSVTGHEETATINLNNLEESFSYHTR